MIYEKFEDWFFELENHCLRAERFYDEGGYLVVNWLRAAFEAGASQVAAKQAIIDRLMLEYCPDEMSEEQFEEWARHQRPVED